MKTLLTFGICVGFCTLLLGQKPRYNCYQKFIEEGRTATKNPLSFKLALQKFNAARRCDPSKSDSVDIEIDKLFTQIIALKNKADASEKKANATAIELIKKNKEVEKTLVQVKQEQAKNKRIIDAFYFYNDRFGLALKDVGGDFSKEFSSDFDISNMRYGFIDKDGTILINFLYDTATPFDQYDGFSRVTKDGKRYLLDTLGKEYLLAQSIGEISPLITALDLHNQQWDSIPSLVFQQPQLQILLAYQNRLHFLPPQINILTSLQMLDLSSNPKLKKIPKEVEGLKNLQALDLGYNSNLSSIPKELGQLKNLQTLDLSNNDSLMEIPKEIGKLENLQTLNLSSNPFLKQIPKELGELKNLQTLDLSNNANLNSLPKELGKLTNLHTLNLSYITQLKGIPKELGDLRNLQTLYLRGTSLSVLPKELRKLKKLQMLDLSSIPLLKEIPKELGELENLQTLDLSNNENLNSFPKEFGTLQRLQTLYLSYNPKLSEIPKELGALTSLQTLDLRKTYLSFLPKEFGRLKSLQTLSLGLNPLLKEIPKEIGGLTSLLTLNLRGTSLISLPKDIRLLKNLQMLDLSNCPIPELERKKIKNWLPNCHIEFKMAYSQIEE